MKRTTAVTVIAVLLASISSTIFSVSAAPTTINFDTYAPGVVISNQYQSLGVVFASQGVIWGEYSAGNTEAASPPNFLVGFGNGGQWPPVPPYPINPITFYFVVPGTSTLAATSQVSVTLISVGWSVVTATAYDSSGTTLSTIVVANPSGPWNGIYNKNPITFSGVGSIHKVSIVTTTPYKYPTQNWYDGWGIDNLIFETLAPIPITVPIDIKPGSDPNSVNLGEQGLLPVAILGSASFNVKNINPETVMIGGVGLVQKKKGLMFAYEDVNSDGFLDMVVFFNVPELVSSGVLTSSTTALNLTAMLNDGTPITGTDSIRVVP